MVLKKLSTSLLVLGAVVFGFSTTANAQYQELTRYVNPRIGTGGHGHVFLGANVPFGNIQLGPTEHTRGWDWCSGYQDSDSILIGFGHQHLSGTGIGELGDFAFLPISCKCQKEVKFCHENETAVPGYYAVKLGNPNVFVELTATKRAGFHRYTYGANIGKCLITLNLKQGIGWDQMKECGFRQVNNRELSGFRISSGWAAKQYDYFYAEFNKPVKLIQSCDSIGIFEFDNDGTPLLLKVGVSAVSEDNAKENLKAEIPTWDFNGTVAAANNEWNEQLGKIDIKTDDKNIKTIFYTALYHTMVAPSVFSDVNGEYRGSEGKVHKGDFTDYTTFSLWDTYRAAHPLMTIIHPEMLGDIAGTLMHIYKEQKQIPIWHLMGNETYCMPGNPGIPVLADLVLKGWVKDKEGAFEAMKNSALRDDRGQDQMRKYGYIPFDKDTTFETVAKTLEYALADDGIAKVAKMLGKKDDYRYFNNLAQAYRRIFDKSTLFMRGKDSKGNWRTPFNPFHSIHRQDDYTEGNAWQYTWLVPHDVHGLVSLFPSEKAFVGKLDSLFIVHGDLGGEASPDISGLIGEYAQGNEPSHHVLYMYNYVGQPWKGAKLIRRSMNEMYTAEKDGLSGNEDVGAMSAWYVISAMGLYQVEPAGGKYIFGSPILDEAKVNVGDRTFDIIAHNNSKENMYIQSVKLNGKKYNKSYILYKDIMNGGKLEFFMGNKPSKFGTAKNDRP